jgi:hypothetical protein
LSREKPVLNNFKRRTHFNQKKGPKIDGFLDALIARVFSREIFNSKIPHRQKLLGKKKEEKKKKKSETRCRCHKTFFIRRSLSDKIS